MDKHVAKDGDTHIVRIQNILFLYNDSKKDERSFKNVVNIAKCLNAKITILSCIREEATFGFFKTKSDKKTTERHKKSIEKKVVDLKNLANKHEVKILTRVIKCDIASEKILKYVKNHDIDIVVVTKSNHSKTIERYYVESTIDKVFRESPCTVLYVK